MHNKNISQIISIYIYKQSFFQLWGVPAWRRTKSLRCS